VRGLQARIEVKKEVMEEEQQGHTRRHAKLQSVVEAKIQESAELRGRLNDIALAFECTLCFEKLGAGSVSFGCGHTYCNRATCASRLVDTCPECRLPVASRVQLFGALPDVGGLPEQEPEAPDVEQVQRLASEQAKASPEEIRKRSEEDQAVWQREKKEMQQQVNRLQEDVLAAAYVNASLEEIRKRSEEDKAVWKRERKEMQWQVRRLQEEVLAAANANGSKSLLEWIRVQSNDHINKLLNSEKMKTKQMTLELDAERLGKKDALQQHVTEQTKKRLSGGDKEQNAVPLPAALPPNKKQKQNVPGKACDADSLIAQHAGLSRQGNEAAVVQGMLTHSEHAGMQEQACAALRNLAFNDVKSSKTAEAGGIEAVVAGMEAHKASVLVQQNACTALWNLALQGSLRQRINTAGGVECVKHAVNASNATANTKGLGNGLLDKLT
jgi:hypothetical protein